MFRSEGTLKTIMSMSSFVTWYRPVSFWFGPWFHDAELLIGGSADIRAIVAPLASHSGKCVEAGFLGVGQGRLVSLRGKLSQRDGVTSPRSNAPMASAMLL